MTKQQLLKRRFLQRVHTDAIESLFAHMSDVFFFVKDTERRFVVINQAFLSLVGRRGEDDVIGAKDADFFPPALCEKFAEDDTRVLQHGESLIDRLELVPNASGSVDWHNTTKVPLVSASGQIIGVAGVTRDLKRMQSTNERFLVMAPVIDTIMNRYAEPLPMAELAGLVSLSVSQFERQFKRRFRVTPLRYILEVRINVACQLLAETELPISEIALRTGFYDQSHFSHAFAKRKGVSPRVFRSVHQSAMGAA